MPTCGTSERSSAVNVGSKMEDMIRNRIMEASQAAPGSIGDILQFRVVSYDEEENICTMTCKTEPWMRNFAGTLHGGMGATILDQAMGIIAYCLKHGEGTAPAVQLTVNYHRPLIPGEAVRIKVRMVSVTRSLISLSAELTHAEHPDKVCLSGSGTYFYKPSEG